MVKPQCHYSVKARTAYKNERTGEIEFNAIEKQFHNDDPWIARKEAFKFRNEFIYGMLVGIGLNDNQIGWNRRTREIENLSDRQIRELLNPYFEDENESTLTKLRLPNGQEKFVEWEAPDDSLSWYTKYNSGIWVTMSHNDDEIRFDNEPTEIVIDKICRYEYKLPIPPVYDYLEEELKFYEKHGFNTENNKTEILFFDDEAFENGDAETDSLKSVSILKTPFDWTGYDKIYWWVNDEDDSPFESVPNQLPVTIKEAFAKGEHEFAEFKPVLTNQPGSLRDFEYEAAKTICAFLNSNGGYLFIGLNDDGHVYKSGIDFSRKDIFLREFTRIKAHYLPQFIAHTIYGEFYTLEEKTIFVITVFPSTTYPIFLRKKDIEGRLIKEFYLRSDAASRHIYDCEEVVKYCRTHWK